MFSGIKFEIAVIALGVLSAVLMTVAVLMMEHARKSSSLPLLGSLQRSNRIWLEARQRGADQSLQYLGTFATTPRRTARAARLRC